MRRTVKTRAKIVKSRWEFRTLVIIPERDPKNLKKVLKTLLKTSKYFAFKFGFFFKYSSSSSEFTVLPSTTKRLPCGSFGAR